MVIREIDRASDAEVRLVAERMRDTLTEVLGPERGEALYTMEWLVARVRWHLDPVRVGAVLVAVDEGSVSGHAIARIERERDGVPFGYFSTVFVAPPWRNRGTATALMVRAATNARLLRLFGAHGYRVTLAEGEMVQLTKTLVGGPAARVKA